MRPPLSRMTFCALTSRCSRPAPWTAASAAQRSCPISAASRAPNVPRSARSARAIRRARAPSTGRRGRRAARRRRPGRRAEWRTRARRRASSSMRSCAHGAGAASIAFVVQQLQRDFAGAERCPTPGIPRTTCPDRCDRATTGGPSGARPGSLGTIASAEQLVVVGSRSGMLRWRVAMLSTSRR